jgi:hypothetical protein
MSSMMVSHRHTVGRVSIFTRSQSQHVLPTLDLRFLHGMHADKTLRRFDAFLSAVESTSATNIARSLGRKARRRIFDVYR